jgi:D-alanine-D-alanine ligase
VFLRADDEIVINEVNTMPGFTPISMFPMLWEAEGLPFRAVVEELVLLARARHARRRSLRTHRIFEEGRSTPGHP